MENTPATIDILLGGTPTADAVRRLEGCLLQAPQVDLSTTNVIHGRMCARTIFVPADTVLTGALTNIDNVCIVQGDISVTTDAGVQRLTGYNVLTAKAGAKRVGYAHADTWWTTIHHTDLTDVEAIEEEMTNEASRLQTRTLALRKEAQPALEVAA